ncbi:MAG TPA: MFS transporter [Anaeromyxobacteraceae bacterium]
MPATVPPPAAPARRDAEVIGLVGLAHATSHFFHLMLPALFPWLMRDFGLGFVEVGSLVTAFFVVSGAGQAMAGFAVDRLGSLRVLACGLSLFAVAAVALSLAPGYPVLLGAAAVAGLGNSVLHPADFTLLNRRVSAGRLGHAFSVHSLSGNLGWAVAPVFFTGVAAAAGWRAAAAAATAVSIAPVALLLARRKVLAGPAEAEPAPGPGPAPRPVSTFAFLGVGAVWMCFLFFLVSTMAFGAIQNYGPAVLQRVYGLSLASAARALTLYLLGAAGGVLLGGVLASRSQVHERLVAGSLGLAALLALVLAGGGVPALAVGAWFALIGFSTGFASPSRDLLIRRAALERSGRGAFGRIYGFVYSGLDVGLSVAPILFGRLMDRGMSRAVLGGVAALQVLAVLAALRVGSATARRAPGPAA